MTPERRAWLLLPILLLSLIHSGLYASYMPAWGLLDEEQHFHYVQSLAEQRAIPVVGQTTLSPQIVDSLFETRRWEHFMWPSPPSHNPADMELEGYSYEGYQPPLYYLVMAPLYTVWPGSILSRLFALRWASVALSLVSILLVFRSARLLLGRSSPIPFMAVLLMALIPERAATVSRVSNDVAVEVSAAAVILVCTVICLRGLSWRSSLLLGATFGLAVLSKATALLLIVPVAMACWFARRGRQSILQMVVAAGVAAALMLPWVARNIRLYGDLTGAAGFDRIAGFSSPPFSWLNLVAAAWDLVRHFWFIWWKAGFPAGNWLTSIAEIALAALLLLAIYGLVKHIRALNAAGGHYQQLSVFTVYIVTVVSYCLITLLGYFGDNLPLVGGRLPIPVVPSVLQGRYLLPVLSPVVILLTVGLWQLRLRRVVFPAVVAGLAALSLLSLFGNLVIYHYFWAPIASRGLAANSLSYGDRVRFLVAELVRDKPAVIRALLTPLFCLFAVFSVAAPLAAYRAAARAES